MVIKRTLSKSLGIHAPSRIQWISGMGQKWLDLHNVSGAGGAILTFKVYDEEHIWESGKGLHPRNSEEVMLNEAKLLGFTPVMSWIPFTHDNPAGPLTTVQRDSLLSAARHIHNIWPEDVTLSFGNQRAGTNWNGTNEEFFSIEEEVYGIWDSLGRKVIPASDSGMVFDASNAKRRAVVGYGGISIGTHAYGFGGTVSRHIEDFNDALDYQLKGFNVAVTPVYLEIHRWFPQHTEPRDANPELFTAETGAYLLELKKAADRVKAELCFFTVDMFFNDNGTPNKAGLALAGKIQAAPWKPVGDKNVTYRLRKLAGDSEVAAKFEAQFRT